MKKKRIIVCHVQVPFVRGGAEYMVDELCRQLNRSRFESETVMVPFKWYPKSEIMKHALIWRELNLLESNGKNIDLVICTKFPSYGIRHPNKVTWLIHQHRQVYDLFNSEYSNFKCGKRDLLIRDEIKKFDQISLNESKKLFTISKNIQNRLKKYNKISSELLYPPPRQCDRFFHEQYGNYILSVGRLDKLKRVDLLIRALTCVDREVHCYIVGSGPEEAALRKLVSAHCLEERVKFLGIVEDNLLIKLYANCLCVFFAPFQEDYGLVTLEAFLSKKPVITTNDAGGVLEFVVDRQNGFVLEPNPEEIGAHINLLFDQRNTLCPEFGNMGHGMVKDINWQSVIQKLTESL